jgi:hypothetical protein
MVPRSGLGAFVICSSPSRPIPSRRGFKRRIQGRPGLTGAFDPGHRPVQDPSGRRHHAIGRSPLQRAGGAVPVNAGVRPERGADPTKHAKCDPTVASALRDAVLRRMLSPYLGQSGGDFMVSLIIS